MNVTHPHVNRPAGDGVVYARTREGFDLPVIDVTHPRFAVEHDPAAVRATYGVFV